MLHHLPVQWPTGIWQPAGVTLALVEGDDTAIDAITNAFIQLTQRIGIDPIHDTVKEGPAGLIARLENSGTKYSESDVIMAPSVMDLAAVDTSDIGEKEILNRGNARAMIYPSGRALLSYLYDTPFFNTIDELIQHGNLNLRGKLGSHHLREVHLSTVVSFYQGALVNLTNSSHVQNNMAALLRQMLVFWPTSGTKRHPNAERIDVALYRIEKIALEGIRSVEAFGGNHLILPELPAQFEESMLSSPGVGVRYTVLNRRNRISKIAIGVAFWRIAGGGEVKITKGDLAVAESILHLHEMGGRLYELVMTKGRMGHEFMRVFVSLLDGSIDSLDAGSVFAEEMAQASELSVGAAAIARLKDMFVVTAANKLTDEYRYVTGNTIREHKRRWQI